MAAKYFSRFLIAVTSNLIIKSKHEKDKSRLVTEAILQSLWVSDVKSSPIESYTEKCLLFRSFFSDVSQCTLFRRPVVQKLTKD